MGGRDFSDPVARVAAAASAAVVIGELVALADDGRTPMVVLGGASPGPAMAARSTVDLFGAHIGSPVVMVFEDGDCTKPIVTGVLRGGARAAEATAPVVIETDGTRLLVEGKQQLVLRCGKASLTLTAAGKVLIEGAYVSSRSSGVNRIKGGSVQLN